MDTPEGSAQVSERRGSVNLPIAQYAYRAERQRIQPWLLRLLRHHRPGYVASISHESCYPRMLDTFVLTAHTITIIYAPYLIEAPRHFHCFLSRNCIHLVIGNCPARYVIVMYNCIINIQALVPLLGRDHHIRQLIQDRKYTINVCIKTSVGERL